MCCHVQVVSAWCFSLLCSGQHLWDCHALQFPEYWNLNVCIRLPEFGVLKSELTTIQLIPAFSSLLVAYTVSLSALERLSVLLLLTINTCCCNRGLVTMLKELDTKVDINTFPGYKEILACSCSWRVGRCFLS